MQGSFKADTPFAKRVELRSKLCATHPDRIPIIVETINSNQLLLNRRKFLAPVDMTVGGLLIEIRKQASVRDEDPLFLFCGENRVLIPTTSLVKDIYRQYKDEDGFLYICVGLENSFSSLYSMSFGLLDSILNVSQRISRTFF